MFLVSKPVSPVRLKARTSPSQGENTSSILVRDTKCLRRQSGVMLFRSVGYARRSSSGQDTSLSSWVHGFKSRTPRITNTSGSVAQLVRATACQAVGRGFKSRHFRHFSSEPCA